MSDARLILVARVSGAVGVRGEIRIATFTADPRALVIYRDLLREDGAPGLTLTSGRPAKGGLVARAEGVETRNEAEALRGLQLYVPRNSLAEPDEDEFYLADLIGLDVRNLAGVTVGTVKAIENFGAGDLVEIAPVGGPTFWLPFTKEAVPDVRIADGCIVIDPPAETTAEDV